MHRNRPITILIPVLLCTLLGALLPIPQANADDWPQWRGPSRDSVWHETGVVWSHPAYANKHVYIRNDQWLVCADLSAK